MVKGKPSKPQNLRVTKVTDNTVSLEWDEPATDGGAMIKTYVIEKRDSHRHTYAHIGSTQSTDFKVLRLQPGGEYVFQVSAENSVGMGDPAEIMQAITDKSQFGKW